MDDVEKIMSEIEKDTIIANTRFTSGFLNDVADVYEKYGIGRTKLFLIDKQSRRELQRQAEAVRKVIEILENFPSIKTQRSTCRLILKSINSIKEKEKRW